MKKIVLAALTIAAMTSCNDMSNVELALSDTAATFTSAITRASGEAWEDGDKVGIVVTDTSQPLSGYKFNALYNVDASTSEFSADTELDKFYYPMDGSSVHFYAYYPHSTAVNATEASYPVNTAVQSVPKSLDLMEASTKGGDGYSKASGAVALQFNRRMTKLTFTLKAGASVDLADISTISLEGFYTTASYDFASNSFKTVGGVASITPFAETTANTYSAILIPTHDGDVAVTAHSTPQVKFVMADGSIIYWALDGETLKAGDNNSYNVTIAQLEVTTTSDISPWNPEAEDDLTAE